MVIRNLLLREFYSLETITEQLNGVKENKKGVKNALNEFKYYKLNNLKKDYHGGFSEKEYKEMNKVLNELNRLVRGL